MELLLLFSSEAREVILEKLLKCVSLEHNLEMARAINLVAKFSAKIDDVEELVEDKSKFDLEPFFIASLNSVISSHDELDNDEINHESSSQIIGE